MSAEESGIGREPIGTIVPTRSWREVVPNEVKFYAMSDWGFWDGVQLVHMAHALPSFSLSSNVHTLFVYRGAPIRYRLKGGAETGDVVIYPDSVSFIPADTPYEVEADDLTQEDIGLKILPEFMESAAREAGIEVDGFEFQATFSRSDARGAEILKMLLEDFEMGCPYGREFGQSLARKLAVHVYSTYGNNQSARSEHAGPLSARALREIEHFVKANIGEKIGLAEVSDMAGYSSSHFHRIFKESTGLRLHDYMMRIRLGVAKDLLTTTESSISSIAYETGFSDHSHLSRNFEKAYGLSPKEYRRTELTSARLS